MINDIAFVVRASDLCPDGAIIDGKRARTHEVKDIGGTSSSPPSPPSLSMSFKDKVSADFGMAEDNMGIGDDDYVIQNGEARGKFARICVELDISKPLTLFIVVEGRTYGVVYEGFQVICFECGYYGHGRDNCPLNRKVKAQASEATKPESMKDVHSPNNKVVVIENLEGIRPEQVVGVVDLALLSLETDPKDATITNQNSPIGVKKATHISAPKKIFGRGKPPFAKKSPHVNTKSSTSRMIDHSQAWEALARLDSDLLDANDVLPVTQGIKMSVEGDYNLTPQLCPKLEEADLDGLSSDDIIRKFTKAYSP
ncbi:hypothetical protein SADUNF_Sadunf16G0085800 [Salix dunnii]|uniref:CCHC-type domain-containing protein n=1 Tax=Salix dunnii TaxID=1413687 RepID=A0A835MIL5_9ROSI|nr:hypothetical protein SADUNF_Sadunf16G0085800 [Salix dunnii]